MRRVCGSSSPRRYSPGPPRRRSPPPRRLSSPSRRSPPPPPPSRHSRSPPLHSCSRSISPYRTRGPLTLRLAWKARFIQLCITQSSEEGECNMCSGLCRKHD
ncbi:hypothetical protein VPH35_047898 [Triticum aestivum]|uniref:Uncharacterized protein n=1 Tax=Triticum urartu TaxID=4572 RepID=A0A8R7U0Y8_TRIUA